MADAIERAIFALEFAAECAPDNARNYREAAEGLRTLRTVGMRTPVSQRDYCTDPYNCRRCKAAVWDQKSHHHAGIPMGTQQSNDGVKGPEHG